MAFIIHYMVVFMLCKRRQSMPPHAKKARTDSSRYADETILDQRPQC